MPGVQARFDPLRQLNLFDGVEQGDLADLVQVRPDQIGGLHSLVEVGGRGLCGDVLYLFDHGELIEVGWRGRGDRPG